MLVKHTNFENKLGCQKCYISVGVLITMLKKGVKILVEKNSVVLECITKLKKELNIVRFRGPRVDPVNTKFYQGVLASIKRVADQEHGLICMLKVTTEQSTKDFTPLLHQLKVH